MKRLLLLVVLVCACGRTQKDVQRDYAKSLYPARLGRPVDAPQPKARILRARVYADEDHRNLVLGWEVRFYRQVQRVNRVLEQQLQVRIEIESARPWPRERGISNLGAALFDLEALDKGEDVDFVIGLTTPLPAVTASIHQLGMAKLFGKHLVLRAMDDADEFASLARVLGKLDQSDWERLYNARVRHKEAVVLLHELGHALGAIHTQDKPLIMHPAVTQYAAFFSNENALIMLAALEGRGDGQRDKNVREAMVAAIEAAKSPRFIEGEREKLLAILAAPERLANANDQTLAPDMDPDDPTAKESFIPPPPPSKVDQARKMATEGDTEAAWLLIEPVLGAEPDNAHTQLMGCDIAMRRQSKADATLALCQRAAALAPEDVRPHLLVAYVASERDEPATALASLETVEALLAKSDDNDADTLVFMAELYRTVSAVTLAEEAARRAGNDERAMAVRSWANKVRDVYGLARGVTMTPAAESAYLSQRAKIQTDLADGNYDAADERAAKLAEKYPGLPNPDLELCEAFARMKEHRRAEFACHRVLRRDKKSAEAYALLGVIAFQKGRVRRAVKHLERSIAIDASRSDLWSLLDAAYRATGQNRKSRLLAERYQDQFKRPLR